MPGFTYPQSWLDQVDLFMTDPAELHALMHAEPTVGSYKAYQRWMKKYNLIKKTHDAFLAERSEQDLVQRVESGDIPALPTDQEVALILVAISVVGWEGKCRPSDTAWPSLTGDSALATRIKFLEHLPTRVALALGDESLKRMSLGKEEAGN